MIKFLTLVSVIFSLSVVTPAFGQTSTEKVEVDITKLSPQELVLYQQLKQKEARQATTPLTPESFERYAQIGKSFGTAFKECWTTVSSDAEKFANSSAGKWAMVMVTWKIMGDDAINLMEKSVQYCIGIPLLFIGTLIFIFMLRRNCIEHPTLVSATKVGFLTVKREYKGMTDAVWNGEATAICVLLYGLFVAVCCAIMFIG